MKAASCSKVTLEIPKNLSFQYNRTKPVVKSVPITYEIQQIISNPEGRVCGEHRKTQVYNHRFNYLK